ncbi:MAG: hypothetical protein CMI00_09860 [Oceanospirillaceae bacterium]|nr:hypothetical protein [Oceanospirillaceae bacterium]|tara:strand:- start:224 stop:1111 length:888 start_codon:yes stop_codon:yes gene_type:complete
MKYRLRLLVLLCSSASVVFAEDSTTAQADAFQAPAYTAQGATIGVTGTRQEYASGDDGEGTQVYLSPYFIYNQWMFSAYLSVEKTSGQYLSEPQYPQLTAICSQPQPRGRFRFDTPALDAACEDALSTSSNTEDETGLNDILLFASYDFILPDPDTGLSLGLSYTHDNGNYETGHGSGTRDLYADISGFLYIERLTLWGSLGYTHILSNSTPFELDDYGVASVGASWRAQDWLSLSTSANAQQSSVENGDGYHYFSLGLNLGKAKGLGGNLTLYKYEDNPGLPEQEISAGVSYSF